MKSDEYLPGHPRKRLIREFRRHLVLYAGCRPGLGATEKIWRTTWAWANAIAQSYASHHWPLPTEIATQYLVLLLASMKEASVLRLPYRAARHVPPLVAAVLGATPIGAPRL